jgi:hypothetical protein
LKFFHREFKTRRQTAWEASERFMTYTAAMARLRKALAQ